VNRKVLRTTIVLIVLFAPWGVWRLLLLRDVHAKIASIREQGLPTNARGLDRWYRRVPDEQNAGLVIHEACAQTDLGADHKALQRLKISNEGTLSKERLALAREMISEREKVLALVDRGIMLTNSRYPIDLTLAMATPVPDLAYARNFALFYQLQELSELDRGSHASASSNIVKCILLARTFDGEPILISQMVRLKILGIAFEMIERRLAAAPVSPAEIQMLSHTLEELPSASEQLGRGLIGERACLMTYFNLNREEAARLFKEPTDDPIAANTFPRRASTALRIAGFYDLDLGFFLHSMGIAIERAEMGPPESLGNCTYLRRAGEVALRRHYFVSGSALGAYGSAFTRFADAEAQWRLGVLALNIEQFRNQKARLPKELDELGTDAAGHPRFLQWDDPYNGRPLKYKVNDGGYVVYSVGEDLRDNGGVPAPERRKGRSGYDLVLRVVR
jgi:hypothetical protein